jgi:hypothetical protein
MSQCVKGLWLGPAESPHNRGGPRDTAAGHYQGLGTLLLSVSRREEAHSTGWFEESQQCDSRSNRKSQTSDRYCLSDV